jgi:uncharacterized phage-associated protein
MSTPFHFHYKKAYQAIAALLRAEPERRMNYYRLLKLLYIADRESIRRNGRPIIGGRLIAMERGPLHSAGFDLVQGKGSEIALWSQFFSVEKFDLAMIEEPGNDDLSGREIDLLNDVRMQHELDDDWAVGQKTHEYGEFIKHKPSPGKSNTIPFEDVLEAIGLSGECDSIAKAAKEKAAFDQIFGA